MKLGILIVAYNAQDTLAKVLDRIPTDFATQIDSILVCDDASTDDTHNVGLRYQSNSKLPLTIVRHQINLGYGGNQKTGYQWALEKNLDLVVLLHGDGQYAPEYLPQMVEPIVSGRADVVFGSRMITQGGARKGGMPLYKFVGNKILTTLQNRLAKVSLTEWHSGYRAYSVSALRKVNFLKNSDYFDFDSQIILQMIGARQRIVEI
ncbi:MAG: glycosyltransferase family 2 protein, partial [Ilumatobacteraceae bacterium]